MKTYIAFDELPRHQSLKTKRWRVFALADGVQIGEIRWFGRWRQYSFFPIPDTVFEKQCLRDIANFCEHQTKTHRTKA